MTRISGRALGDLLEAGIRDLPEPDDMFVPYLWRRHVPADRRAELDQIAKAADRAWLLDQVWMCACGARNSENAEARASYVMRCWKCGASP